MLNFKGLIQMLAGPGHAWGEMRSESVLLLCSHDKGAASQCSPSLGFS